MYEKISTSLLNDIAEHTKPLMDFYNIEQEEATIMAILIQNTLLDNENSIKQLMSHFKDDTTIIPQLNSYIDELCKKNLLFLVNRKKYKSEELSIIKKVIVNNKAIEALLTADNSLFALKKENSFFDVIVEINELLPLKKDGLIDTDSLLSQVCNQLQANHSFKQIQWLNSLGLSINDMLIFLVACYRYYNCNEEDFFMYCILDEIYDENIDKYKYKKGLKNNTNKLLVNKLVEAESDWMNEAHAYKLTQHAKNVIFEMDVETTDFIYYPTTGNIIKHEGLKEEQLFYNNTEANQIDLIQNAVMENNFKSVCLKLEQNNLKAGLTILLYGYAGTGKTSTVMQIAKKTERNIFMIEVNKIKAAFVGETENNIKEVFNEYRKLCKKFDKAPILLFNEADSIISKRIDVQRSVDQMNNSMQNILLQELENFEGIFIATTNLTNNLDTAFDRRFLYKIEYTKPQAEVRYKILKNNFCDINDDLLQTINTKYAFTGGQIMNLKKKLLIQNLLEAKDYKDIILPACEQEIGINNGSLKTSIGFIK
jgi:hypothetical protein